MAALTFRAPIAFRTLDLPRHPRPRALLFGTYDPTHTRNRVIIQLLDAAGWDIAIVRRDLWGAERFSAVRSGRLRLAVRALATYVRLAIHAFTTARPDIAVVLYPGHFDMLLLAPIWKLRRVPVVFDPLLALYDTIVTDRHLVRAHTANAALIAGADRLAFRLADLVLVDTPEVGAYYAQRYGVAQSKQLVVWASSDETVLGPPATDPGVPGRVLFHGSFIALHGIDTIVRAAAVSDADIEFIVIGAGQESGTIAALIRDLGGVPNLTLRPPMPLTAIADEIRRASVCLGIFGTTPKAGRVVPFKVFEYLALGRPVITADTPAVRHALGDDVVRVAAGDPGALAVAVRALLDDPDRRELLSRQGRTRFESEFSSDAQSQRLGAALADVVGPRR